MKQVRAGEQSGTGQWRPAPQRSVD
jgi:hypothetical protein